jgi:hypothetical protein
MKRFEKNGIDRRQADKGGKYKSAEGENFRELPKMIKSPTAQRSESAAKKMQGDNYQRIKCRRVKIPAHQSSSESRACISCAAVYHDGLARHE